MLSFSAALFTLSGCGSGGGGNAAPASPTAVVTLSAQGTVASPKLIHGIELYLILPAGVTVKTDTNGKVPSSGVGAVVVAAGDAAGLNTSVLANYPVTDPVDGNTNAIKVEIIDTDGFDPGNFVTVTCDRAAGASPNQADFKVTGFKPVDQTGNTISSLSVDLASVIK